MAKRKARRAAASQPNTSKIKRLLYALLGVIVFSGLLLAYNLYERTYRTNVSTTLPGEFSYLEIPTGSEWRDVLFLLQQGNFLRDVPSFEWVAQKAGYPERVLPGRYKIEQGMNNVELVKMLASGRQEPVRLVINKFRNKYDLFGAVARRLEADSTRLAQLFTDDKLMRKHGFNEENSLAMIIPNTYEFWWNTSAMEFMEKMLKEHAVFWTAERKEKARRLGLQPAEVMTLASIVEEETNQLEEKGTIARVYLNRLNIGMKLQADPTVRFAIGDFSIKRVRGAMLNHASPYNTYYAEGLPPGPICTPSIPTIDAVLNSSPNDYLYFCAREDFSGFHSFAKNYRDHQLNAQKYQKALNQRNILR
jgi:UPF0755 protein